MALNKHQQRTEETRRKLLSAGLRIFARTGFEASRIEDIAAEAGHSRGAFYANFDTKEDLFFALLEQQAGKRVKLLQTLLEGVESPEERLRVLRKFYVGRVGDRQWVMLTLEFKLFALRHGNLRAKLASAHRRIRASMNMEALEKLLPVRHFDQATKEMEKVILEVVLNGLVLEHAYDPKRISEQQAIAMLGRVFDVFIRDRPGRP
jgi:AcrR family transcriptional regulator